jgi:hypothetical protein
MVLIIIITIIIIFIIVIIIIIVAEELYTRRSFPYYSFSLVGGMDTHGKADEIDGSDE